MWWFYLIQIGIHRLTCKCFRPCCLLAIYIPPVVDDNHDFYCRQAQDRAHRIGQKKEVQVFRLVTEDTIEQKIVERAQQKLKLDAMVVQQGRLKEKDKLSRDELLDAIRFGADKIFKSKDSSITDDDVSAHRSLNVLIETLFWRLTSSLFIFSRLTWF